MKKQIAVLGAGNRGREAYGNYILENPDEAEINAVAEPNPEKRKVFAKEHKIKEENVFKSW